MKPHQLRIEAFGPYANPVAIDFDDLNQEGLFLIHGTTGAGKTFLLDALCFALYGEVSGDRSVKGLKSDHAEPTAVPRVSLEFSTAGARYRVQRSPAHTALRSRGGGTTEKAAQACLFRLVGSDWEPIVSRTTEVSREVEGLIGLNAGQFRQVILLPQGRFAEVLRARAEEREALLKTLFDTVIFEQAGSWLEDQAKAARGAVSEQNRAQEVLRRQAAQAWSPHAPAPAPLQSEANCETNSEANSATRVEANFEANGQEAPGVGEIAAGAGELPVDQEGLDRLESQMAAVVRATDSRLRQAAAALESARGISDQRLKLADRWDRRAEASSRLEQRQSRRPQIDQLRQQLARAERAEGLRASLDAEQSAQQALRTLQSRINRQLLEAIRARDAAQALPVSVLLLDLMALPGIEELGEAIGDLAARRAEVDALTRTALEASHARAWAAEATTRARQAEADRQRSSLAREKQRQALQTATEAFRSACTARDRLDGLQRAAQEAHGRAEALEAIASAQRKENAAVAAANRADRRLNQAQAAQLELRRQQLTGMAALLADGLKDGAACPVCGSVHHPDPAQHAPDAVSEAAIAAAESAVTSATLAARQAAVHVAQAQAECQAAREKAGSAADDPQTARAAARDAAAALAAARAQAQTLAQLDQSIKEHEDRLSRLEADIQAASTQLALQTRAAAEEGARAERLSAEIAAQLGPNVDPRPVLEAFQPLGAALQALAGSCEISASARTRLDQAAARLQRELHDSGFADGQALEAALQERAVRQEWSQQIEAFDRDIAALNGILSAAELADLPAERPDTAAALAAVVEADAARTAALERHTQARGAQADIQRLSDEHRRGAAVLARSQERAQLLSRVADRCQGRSAPFISLQRWVLSAYLADICRHANQRLELMTSGRYQLRLTDDGGRGGRHAGLGLRVLDAYTGEEREVSSLSGGETFQASLALALGVADTVQAHTGGVHLDALFIDEGFGSLDPDSLQLAMDELDRLREGGRLIGIISHVSGLRERIRSGIEVVASERGSRIRIATNAHP